MQSDERNQMNSGVASNRLDGRGRGSASGDTHDGHTKIHSVSGGEGPPPHLPPATAVAKSGSSKIWLWVCGGLLAVGVLGLVGVGAIWIGVCLVSAGGSLQDDEVHSPQKGQADFKTWKGYMTTLGAAGREPGSLGLPQPESKTRFSWWQQKTALPNENAVRSAFMRRLPSNFKLVAMQPVHMEKADSGVSVVYQVTLRCTSTEYRVPVDNLKLASSAPKGAEKLVRFLVVAPDLPAGQIYLTDEKTALLREGETVQFAWVVRQASKADRVWRVLDAEPVPFQTNPGYEYRFIELNPVGSTTRLRSAEELGLVAAQQDKRCREFCEQFARIHEQAAAFRSERMASVPGVPKKGDTKFGGSGSGEPTKTATRMGGGAATGAGIGALAGGGEGAGWGALGGFLVGGIYDAVSKSNDKKKFEAAKQQEYEEQKAGRAAALRTADREAAAYEKKLLADFESELREEARGQENKLRLAAGI